MRGGDPGQTYDLSLLEIDALRRFFSKIEPPQDCWTWRGPTVGRYGSFNSGAPHRATYRSHRLAYSILRGDIPEGLSIDHLCGNPRCVNPWHLDLVPNEQNLFRQNRSRPRIDPETFRLRRKQLGLLQREVECLSGISLATIRYIERGISKGVQPRTLVSLAEALKCRPIDLLVRGSEEQSA